MQLPDFSESTSSQEVEVSHHTESYSFEKKTPHFFFHELRSKYLLMAIQQTKKNQMK